MTPKIINTIAGLFQRGLEALVSAFFHNRNPQQNLRDTINDRLSQFGEQATNRAVNEFAKRVKAAEIAADILSQIGTVSPASIPKAPGKDFTNPETGEVSSQQTTVVIQTGDKGPGETIAVPVYHRDNATWREIKDDADRKAKEIANRAAKYKRLRDWMDANPDKVVYVPLRTFRQ